MKDNLDISYIFSNFAPYKNNIINSGSGSHNTLTIMITFIISNKDKVIGTKLLSQGNSNTLGKLFDKLNIEDQDREQAYQLTKDLYPRIRIDHIELFEDTHHVNHYIFTFIGIGSRDKNQLYIQDFLSKLNDFFDWEGTTTLTYIEGNTFIGTLNI